MSDERKPKTSLDVHQMKEYTVLYI